MTTSQESDFKDKTLDKQGGDKYERAELIATNILFSIMIVLTVFGTGLLASKNQEFLEELSQSNEEYQLPLLSDFQVTLIAMPFAMVILCNSRLLNCLLSGL
jgi:hypothetical protein